MGWKDFFKKEKEAAVESVTHLSLAGLKTGYMVDYDMKSWEVAASHTYDWGEGDATFEWQLKSHDDTIYLERSPGDEDNWSISRKIPIGRVGAGIREHIKTHGDGPDQIEFEGTTYYLEEFGGGHFKEGGQGPGKEVLKWDYTDDSGKKYLTIEQWSENDFEAAVGMPVEEYQFTDILPGAEGAGEPTK